MHAKSSLGRENFSYFLLVQFCGLRVQPRENIFVPTLANACATITTGAATYSCPCMLKSAVGPGPRPQLTLTFLAKRVVPSLRGVRVFALLHSVSLFACLFAYTFFRMNTYAPVRLQGKTTLQYECHYQWFMVFYLHVSTRVSICIGFPTFLDQCIVMQGNARQMQCNANVTCATGRAQI